MKRLKRLRAYLGNWFIADCPICGREFYGFDIGGCLWTSHSGSTTRGRSTCPRCPGDWYLESWNGPVKVGGGAA